MSGFNPGDGWRRLAKGERDQDEMIVYYGDEGSTSWVRVPAVPPLPTEPYTVIRATLSGGEEADLLLAASGHWGTAYGPRKVWASADDIARVGLITGFEVLAEPRAVTAKAVLDRVRDLLPHSAANEPRVDEALSAIARQFGVES